MRDQYDDDIANGRAFCFWPNPTASGSRREAKALEATVAARRRQAWNDLEKPTRGKYPRIKIIPSGITPKKVEVEPGRWVSRQRAHQLRQRAAGVRFADVKPIQLLPRNVIIWEGPSQFTGQPIFVIATGKTHNRKIGAMVQLWILTAGSPLEAVRSGGDVDICGDCKLRGDHGKERACYVEYFRAPEHIWQSATGNGRGRGLVDRMTPEAFAERVRGMHVRIGAYGDPAAVPIDVWRPMLATAAGWTAYTHQWRTAGAAFAAFCMASVDTPAERLEAAGLGFRTFRVRTATDPIDLGEAVCPASDEGGHKATCEACSLCRGQARRAKDIVIVAHGQRAKWFTSPAAAIAAAAPVTRRASWGGLLGRAHEPAREETCAR